MFVSVAVFKVDANTFCGACVNVLKLSAVFTSLCSCLSVVQCSSHGSLMRHRTCVVFVLVSIVSVAQGKSLENTHKNEKMLWNHEAKTIFLVQRSGEPLAFIFKTCPDIETEHLCHSSCFTSNQSEENCSIKV